MWEVHLRYVDDMHRIAVDVGATEMALFGVTKELGELALTALYHVRPDEGDKEVRAAAVAAFSDIVRTCVDARRDGAIEVSADGDEQGRPMFCIVALLRPAGEIIGAAAYIVRRTDVDDAKRVLAIALSGVGAEPAEPRGTGTLEYQTPEPGGQEWPAFWGPFFGAAVVSFLVTSEAVGFLFGRSNDGRVVILEVIGIVATFILTAFFKSAASNGSRWPTWLAVVLGLIAPASGFSIYVLFASFRL